MVLIWAPLAARADKFPLWEAGAGVAVINFPDYRGSDERQAYVLPVPYFVYRGEFLKVDRQKVRGLFFKSERAELDMSLNGSVPVNSRDNRARQGMPDLDPTLEADQRSELQLRLPLRTVIASDFSTVRHVGWVFQPQLNLDILDVRGSGWNLGFLTGPVFADRKYHRYFYGVEQRFATPERPAFSAKGGYAGSQFIAGVSKRYPRFWLGGFVKWDTLERAAFEDSPLVKTKQYFTAGFAISWIFKQSETMVEAKD
jgi:MipA family protein